MYIPKHFLEQDTTEIFAFIEHFPLATMVCHSDNGLEAHHIPLLLQSQNGETYLIGHFAKANRVWEQANAEWLVIFSEGGQYISPNWYPSKALTHKEVPTWNFRAVHIQGKMQIVEDTDEKLAILDKLTTHFEQASPQPWQLSDAPSDYLQSMAKAIVAFKFVISDIQGKFKLSQNKTPDNVAGMIKGLNNTDNLQAGEMANVMTDYFKKKS